MVDATELRTAGLAGLTQRRLQAERQREEQSRLQEQQARLQVAGMEQQARTDVAQTAYLKERRAYEAAKAILEGRSQIQPESPTGTRRWLRKLFTAGVGATGMGVTPQARAISQAGLKPIYIRGELRGYEDPKVGMSIPMETFAPYVSEYRPELQAQFLEAGVLREAEQPYVQPRFTTDVTGRPQFEVGAVTTRIPPTLTYQQAVQYGAITPPPVPTPPIPIYKRAWETFKDVWRGGFGYGLVQTPRTFGREETYERARRFLGSPYGGIYGVSGARGIAQAAEVRRMRISGEERQAQVDIQNRLIEGSVSEIERAGDFLDQYSPGDIEYTSAFQDYQNILARETAKMKGGGVQIDTVDDMISFRTLDAPITLAREVEIKGTTTEKALTKAVIIGGRGAEMFVYGQAIRGITPYISPVWERLTQPKIAGKVLGITGKAALGGLAGLYGVTTTANIWTGLKEEPPSYIPIAETAGVLSGLALAYNKEITNYFKTRRRWSKKAAQVTKKKGKSKQQLLQEKKAAKKLKELTDAQRERLISESRRLALEGKLQQKLLDTARLAKQSGSEKAFSEYLNELSKQGLLDKTNFVYNSVTGELSFFDISKIPKEKIIAAIKEEAIISPYTVTGAYAGLGIYDVPTKVYEEKLIREEWLKGKGIEDYGKVRPEFKPAVAEISKVFIKPEPKFKELSVLGTAPALGTAVTTVTTQPSKQVLLQRQRIAQEEKLKSRLRAGQVSWTGLASASALAQSTTQISKLKQLTIQVPRLKQPTIRVPKFKFPIFKIPRKPILFDGYVRRRKRRPVKRPKDIFVAHIRRRGKWLQIAKVKDPFRAIAIGKKAVLETLAVSLKVTKKGKPIPLPISPIFRKAKKELGVLVQKKYKIPSLGYRGRLTTGLEIAEIKRARKSKRGKTSIW